MKKTISLILSVLMLLSVVPFCAAAEKDTYVPSYDYETPVVLVHGIGQNDTYVLDENGNRIIQDDGTYVTG